MRSGPDERWRQDEYLTLDDEVTKVRGRAEALLIYKTGGQCYVPTRIPNLPYRRVLTKEEACAEIELGNGVYRKVTG